MKKFILLSLLVCLCLSFTACTKKFDSFESYGTYEGVKYPRFLSTDWGMTEAEALKALGVKDEDVTWIDKGFRGVESWSACTFDIHFDDELLTLTMLFENASEDGVFLDLGLIEVFFFMPSELTKKKWETATSKLEYLETDVYTVCERKGYLDDMPPSYKRVGYAKEDDLSNFVLTHENQEECNKAWADSADGTWIAGSGYSAWREEDVNEEIKLGYCVFNGADLAKLRYLDKTL